MFAFALGTDQQQQQQPPRAPLKSHEAKLQDKLEKRRDVTISIRKEKREVFRSILREKKTYNNNNNPNPEQKQLEKLKEIGKEKEKDYLMWLHQILSTPNTLTLANLQLFQTKLGEVTATQELEHNMAQNMNIWKCHMHLVNSLFVLLNTKLADAPHRHQIIRTLASLMNWIALALEELPEPTTYQLDDQYRVWKQICSIIVHLHLLVPETTNEAFSLRTQILVAGLRICTWYVCCDSTSKYADYVLNETSFIAYLQQWMKDYHDVAVILQEISFCYSSLAENASNMKFEQSAQIIAGWCPFVEMSARHIVQQHLQPSTPTMAMYSTILSCFFKYVSKFVMKSVLTTELDPMIEFLLTLLKSKDQFLVRLLHIVFQMAATNLTTETKDKNEKTESGKEKEQETGIVSTSTYYRTPEYYALVMLTAFSAVDARILDLCFQEPKALFQEPSSSGKQNATFWKHLIICSCPESNNIVNWCSQSHSKLEHFGLFLRCVLNYLRLKPNDANLVKQIEVSHVLSKCIMFSGAQLSNSLNLVDSYLRHEHGDAHYLKQLSMEPFFIKNIIVKGLQSLDSDSVLLCLEMCAFLLAKVSELNEVFQMHTVWEYIEKLQSHECNEISELSGFLCGQYQNEEEDLENPSITK